MAPSTRTLLATLASAAALVTAGTATSPHHDTGSGAPALSRCARQFDRAVHQYVATTDARDAEGFNALWDPQVTVVFANGGVLSGKAAASDFISGFFAAGGFTQTFHELRRTRDACRTGFVLFDSVYAVPAQHRVSPLVIGVSFTRRSGHWLVLQNQDSTGPAS